MSLSQPIHPGSMPWGLKWRSSVWYVTLVVGLGVTVDLLVYSIIIPVLPFQLERLGYNGVSGLVGWLLFGYSGGLVLATIPIAMLSEKYNNRTYPLIAGQLILIGSQIMLMEAPKYWVMIIARILQGVSSSMIWVVGLALLCDTCPERIVGRQLGMAMTGLSLGILIGPPVGGALYNKFGFRGPFILGVIVTAVDLVGRWLIIERKDALLYGLDPGALPAASAEEGVDASGLTKERSAPAEDIQLVDEGGPNAQPNVTDNLTSQPSNNGTPKLSLLGIVGKLIRSPRAIACLFNTLVYGVVFTAQETALPLHLQATYNLDPSKVGLVFLAAVVPSIFSSPFAGWWADNRGTEFITVVCLIASIPWWVLITIRSPLALFIVFLAFESFTTSATVSPLTAELAAVSRSHEGVGYAHVYGAFNLCYGVGAALGPIIGGQIYDHLVHGWTAISLIAAGLLAVSSLLAVCFTGDSPLLKRIVRSLRPA